MSGFFKTVSIEEKLFRLPAGDRPVRCLKRQGGSVKEGRGRKPRGLATSCYHREGGRHYPLGGVKGHREWPFAQWKRLFSLLVSLGQKCPAGLCTGQFQNRPCPSGQTPAYLTFWKNFGQIPCYVASLDGQMPHPLELQRGSNPPPSRNVKQTVETSYAKFSAAANFLLSLPSLHTLNKGIFHDRTI